MLTAQERNYLQRRFAQLDADSSAWRSRCQDVQSYLCPSRGNFSAALPNAPQSIGGSTILNSGPSLALRTLAAALSMGSMSSSQPWFRLGLPDPDLEKFKPARLWLENVENRMYSVFAKSNIYKCRDQIYEECPAFGMGALFVEADYNSVIRGRTFTAGEYFVGANAQSKINVFGRRLWMTIAQLVEEFGLEALTPQRQAQRQNHELDVYVRICHLIEPNEKSTQGKLDSSNKAFRSIYWEDGQISQKTLREAGYDSFPLMVPRWKTRDSMAIHGISPAWECLPDIKMLQEMEHKELIGADKLIDPPMLVPDDFDGEPTFLPGEVIRYSGQNPESVRSAYETKLDLGTFESIKDKVLERTDRAFFRDLLQLVSQIRTQGVTAYQVSKMFEEKLMVLGPVLENFKDELHDPLIDRTFEIMASKGLIPMPPDELRGMELKVEYVSSLAQSQKQIGAAAIEEFYGFHERVCQLYPELKDRVDPDKLIEAYHGKKGAPSEVLRDDAEVEQIREGRAQAELQMAQQQRDAQTLAATKTLGDTKLGKGNALDAALAGAGVQPTAAPGGTA